MSLARRMADLYKVRAGKALDRAEDPRDVLDYSYEQQLELLNKVRRAVADVATSRKRVGFQRAEADRSAVGLAEQAQQALAAGREDLARDALTRRAATLAQSQDLTTQEESLQSEEDRLTAAEQRLEAKVEAFRTRKETIKATYTAAEAQTRITEAVTGISEDMGDVGMAVQRAQDTTDQLQARAAALDELTASGALPDATGAAGPDGLRPQLDAATPANEVEAELAAMRARLPAAPTPSPLEPGPQAAGGAGRRTTEAEGES